MSRVPVVEVPPPSTANKIARALWGIVWLLLYRPSPRPAHGWRRMLLRMFGARIGAGAKPYPSATIWAPWNLRMGQGSTLGDSVDCYSVGPIELGAYAVASQRAYLCGASRDFNNPSLPLMIAPILIQARAWVAAEAFLGPGVTIGEGAVVGARSVVIRDVEPWTVVAGNPARPVAARTRPVRDSVPNVRP